MHTKFASLLTVALSLGAAQAASAADMPVKAPVYKTAPSPIVSWTGCYLGGNIGYGWAPTTWNDAGVEFASHTAGGVVGGGQIGCDYQTGHWVFGIQGMFDGTGMEGDSHKVIGAPPGNPDIFDHTRLSWIATLSGRIGYAVQPITLLYVKGGVAWVRDKHEECCLSSFNTVDDGFANVTRTGWTVGIGLEHMFRPDWSAFAEYNFIGLGTDAITFTPISPATSPSVYDIHQDVHTILVGVNYRFGGFR
jgi:outer membrane immunogenic protein